MAVVGINLVEIIKVYVLLLAGLLPRAARMPTIYLI